MRIRPPTRRRYDRITINLASMIDVSFLLLFYFMTATMMEDRETRLSAGLQTQSLSESGAIGDFQSQNIDVRLTDGVPTYVLGQRVCRTREELAAAIERLPRDAGVFVRVADNVSVEFAITAIQVTRDAGFEQVTYVPSK